MNETVNFSNRYSSAISVFSHWAKIGKDESMMLGHEHAVNFMFNKLKPYFKNSFISLDVGCGNGWVVRKFNKLKSCQLSVGIDGAEQMIKKAIKVDPVNQYICEDLLEWKPLQQFNIIHSMEVLYYLENPFKLIQRVYSQWLNKGGCFIFGIDHYSENLPSIKWPEEYCINMNTKSKIFWIKMMKKAGFNNIQHWQIGKKGDWEGTLVVFGTK